MELMENTSGIWNLRLANWHGIPILPVRSNAVPRLEGACQIRCVCIRLTDSSVRLWDRAYAAQVLVPTLIGPGISMLTTLPPASLRVQCPLNLLQFLFSLLSFFAGSFF
jgi:hypothetical protein